LGVGLLSYALWACGSEAENVPAECSEQTPSELFSQRIEPLFSESRPKSCNQCHLSGVDLSTFARGTACETMACLHDKGMVDFEAPEDSLILTWIERAQPDSSLITEAVIDEEYQGFLDWIRYSASCQSHVCKGVTCDDQPDAPFCPNQGESGLYAAERDPGGCEDRALEQVFRDTVYATRGRCFPCHFSGEKRADPKAPRWVSQEGNCDGASLATMRNVVAGGYVNLADPSKSLLVLKPIGTDNGGVAHGGGAKFELGEKDTAYLNFMYWLTRYADCQNGQ
jgi:hypothetical protein